MYDDYYFNLYRRRPRPFGGPPFGPPMGGPGRPDGPPGPGPGPGGRPPAGPPTGGPGGQQQGPSTPPPSFTPRRPASGPSTFAVDPGAIRPCTYQFVYLWLEDGREFWAYLVFVGPRSVAGFRWDRRRRRWIYFGTDTRNISSFECF